MSENKIPKELSLEKWKEGMILRPSSEFIDMLVSDLAQIKCFQDNFEIKYGNSLSIKVIKAKRPSRRFLGIGEGELEGIKILLDNFFDNNFLNHKHDKAKIQR